MSENRRAVLFINGDVPDVSPLRSMLRADDLLIAVDGGYKILHLLDMSPHWLIGDLDSVSQSAIRSMRSSGVKIQQFPAEKDETDLELAVLHALGLGCKSILLVGMLGGRIDHILGNIHLLEDPRFAHLELRADDGFTEICLVNEMLTLNGTSGDLVSLIPLSETVQGVTTYKLKYPLLAETLNRWQTRGISNEMLDDSALVKVEQGSLICIHIRVSKEIE